MSTRIQTFGYLTLVECAQTEIVDVAHAVGFRSVGLRVEERRANDGYPHVVVGKPQRLREIRERLDATGLRLSNVVGRYLVPETTRDDLARLVDAGAALGCRFVLANGYDPDERRTQDNLSLLADLAGANGIRVAIEFVPYQKIRSLDEAMRYIDAIGSPHLGLVPDPLHLSRSGGTPAQLAAVSRDKIFYAQICDAPAQVPPTLDGCLAEARTARRFLGEGGLPLADYVRALPAECEIEIEVANAELAQTPPLDRARRVRASLEQFLAGV